MKVLMLISSLETGGAETHLCELSRALSSRGICVFVASGGGTLTEELRKHGIPHISIPLNSKSPISLLKSYFLLSKLIKKEKFDIIHAHSRISAYFGNIMSRKYGICFLTTVHAKFSLSPIKKHMSKWGYYVSAVSNDLALYLNREYGIPKKKISVISNGIDTCRFSKKSITKNVSPKILFISRLDSDCSQAAYSLCRIAKALSKTHPKTEITILGGGSEYKRLNKKAEEVNRAIGYKCIILEGNTPSPEQYINESDVLVGVSRVLLEGMSCGVPCVLAGDEGFLGVLERENVQIAAKSNFCGRGEAKLSDTLLLSSICRVLNMNKQQRENLGNFFREYIIQNHSIEHAAEETENLYHKALNNVSFRGGKVCLCGYYGFGNMGDDTLLDSAIMRARGLYGREGISALTKHPKKDCLRFGIRCISRQSIMSLRHEILKSERLIFGGGSLLQDKTSLRSLIYYIYIANIAVKHGVMLEFWGNGIGPLKRKISRKLVGNILKKAEYIELRDSVSEKLVLSLGIAKEKIIRANDLAYSLMPCSATQTRDIPESLNISSKSKIAVIGICGSTDKKTISKLKKRLILIRKEGSELIFIPMYPKEDKEIALRLSKECDGKYAEGLSAEEIFGLLSIAELCIGNRLHILIFSKLANTKFESIGNDIKIRAFCKDN